MSDAGEKRSLKILFLALAAICLILLLGGIYLTVETVLAPGIGFGRELLPMTGCREMGAICIFWYYALFCRWIALLSPLWVIPVVVLLWRQRWQFLALGVLAALPFFSWLEINAGVQSGFRYRAELLERYGKDSTGARETNLMPPEVRVEYEQGSGSETCIFTALFGWILLPLWNLLFLLPGLIFFHRLVWRRKNPPEPKP